MDAVCFPYLRSNQAHSFLLLKGVRFGAVAGSNRFACPLLSKFSVHFVLIRAALCRLSLLNPIHVCAESKASSLTTASN
jgi:hypothetical protein